MFLGHLITCPSRKTKKRNACESSYLVIASLSPFAPGTAVPPFPKLSQGNLKELTVLSLGFALPGWAEDLLQIPLVLPTGIIDPAIIA